MQKTRLHQISCKIFIVLSSNMSNKWSRPESRPKSAGCSRDEMMDEAASKAERIRASRGNYEVEVTCTGEAGLHQCALICLKNPGHDNFIPTKKFNIEHLPSRYRDNLLVDYVQATSDLTCRLSVSHISEDRPETWPDSEKAFPFSACKGENCNMVGTGWVHQVYIYTEKNNINCRCDECRPGTHKPKKTGGVVYITTACHVVFDDEEARHTKCQFFYDSHETDINKVLTLTGLKVFDSDIKGDWCEMIYVTHDLKLLDRFNKMYNRWCDLRRKVLDKYVFNNSPAFSVPGVVYATNVDHDLCIVVSHPHGCTKISVGTWTNRQVVGKPYDWSVHITYSYNTPTNVDHDLCIVVSHPHGCTKEISVGTWTHRQVVGKPYDWNVHITYSYNNPTCPGSSGAPVITLCKDIKKLDWYLYTLPPHTEGGAGNDNNSGVGW